VSGRLNVLLTVLLLISALSLVNAQYHSRRLFIELERAQTQARQLDIEWAQLRWINPRWASMRASKQTPGAI
jgi:cell division protein FtsL